MPLRADYPTIKELKSYDILFLQLQKDVETFYKATYRLHDELIPKLALFTYRPQKNDTLFSVAARLNVPYDTISSLNRISQTAEFGSLPDILIPNTPGLFVPLQPSNTLEEIMLSWRMNKENQGEQIIVTRNGKAEIFIFFRGEKFHSIERAYFLKILFRFP